MKLTVDRAFEKIRDLNFSVTISCHHFLSPFS